MSELITFFPRRESGVSIQIAILILLLGASGLGLWQANQAGFGFVFYFFLLPALLTVIVAPLLVYQLYALLTANYTLEQDGMRLRWGMRGEDIPVDQILWVRMRSEYSGNLPRPFLSLPGAVLGVRRLSKTQDVEYMADRVHDLVLVATQRKIFAISPSDPAQFLFAYQRLAEKGSISPLAPRSVYPSFFFSDFWSDQTARWLLLLGSLWMLVFLAVTAALIPGLGLVSLHIELARVTKDAVPAVRLLILPVINAVLFAADLVLGVLFYRRAENRVLSYILWLTSLVVGMLFVAALVFILRAQ